MQYNLSPPFIKHFLKKSFSESHGPIILVDASEAGVGNLEVAVNEGRIPSMASALGQHRYDISFVPRELADHTITVRFNNEPVPGECICKIPWKEDSFHLNYSEKLIN